MLRYLIYLYILNKLNNCNFQLLFRIGRYMLSHHNHSNYMLYYKYYHRRN
jgi:hypothetical protein